MRRRLIFTNVILLLISLSICLGVSLYISRRNVVSNSKRNLVNYSNLVKNDIVNGERPDFAKYEIVEKSLRTTRVNVTDDGRTYLSTDSMYRDDPSQLDNVNWLELKEYSDLETFVIRRDETSDNRRMLYYDY